jgi:hypothetical protein
MKHAKLPVNVCHSAIRVIPEAKHFIRGYSRFATEPPQFE